MNDQPNERNESLEQAEQQRAQTRRRRRTNFMLLVVAVATILVPFLFWKATWFGRPLTDDELGQYLTDGEHPRNSQHALVQMAERIERGDSGVQRWYPQAAALKDSPVPELRVTLAWMLGSDNRSDLFHKTLLTLLGDPALLVRRNAALALVRFGDASGKSEILAIFRPVAVTSPVAGVLTYYTKVGAAIEANARLAIVETPEKSSVEVHALVPGAVQGLAAQEGARVDKGQEVAILSPPEDHVWEALRALYLIGQPEDLPAVQACAGPRFSDKIRQQAALTAAQITSRVGGQSSSSGAR